MIVYSAITKENFNELSLDSFVRHQEVRQVWCCPDGQWKLVENHFVEDWDVGKCREIAREILSGLQKGAIGYTAWHQGKIVGDILIDPELLGSAGQYMQLTLFHVSEPFRGMGIGRELFRLGAGEAKRRGAHKLYISAHPSRESQAVYRKLGCVHAQEVQEAIALEEPYDVQMEYPL